MTRDRAFLIYYAKVLLRECAARRGSSGAFYWILYCGAQRARREAAALSIKAQSDLFGAAA
jgi:hypothetical protein